MIMVYVRATATVMQDTAIAGIRYMWLYPDLAQDTSKR